MKRNIMLSLLVILMLGLFAGCATPEPFRVHVVANSDFEADQEVKLLVRDALLADFGEHAPGWTDKDDAIAYAEENMLKIESIAQSVLAEHGFSYDVQVQTGNFAFPEKTYADVTYEAGYYDALKVVLGEGDGENWWCVLFPTLCIADIESASEEQPEIKSFFWDLFFSGV